MAINLMGLESDVNTFRDSFINKLRSELNKFKIEIRKEVKKEIKQDNEQHLQKLEKMQLSKANAKAFLNYIKLVDEIEKNGKATKKDEEGQLFELMVRHWRIIEKFRSAKVQIVNYL